MLALATSIACQKEIERPVSRVQYRVHAPSGGVVTLYRHRGKKTINQRFDEYIQLSDYIRPGDSISFQVQSTGLITAEILRDHKSIYFIEKLSRVSLHRTLEY